MKNPNYTKHRFCVAPMLDWTDRHCRYFHRLLSKEAMLYTEMVTSGALIHGDKQRFLTFNPNEHPLAFQLGGSDPGDLALSTRIIEDAGFDEVNLNIGCPSNKVQKGRFGACLMAEPDLVADCIYTMQKRVAIPVTVKSRIGIDEQDSYEELQSFIKTVAQAGCNTFIIHARKAWLKGLSPKQNREVPPLQYETVYQIKRNFPNLEIIVNGGVICLNNTRKHLEHVDGVMIGREVYHNPFLLAEVDAKLFSCTAQVTTRHEIVTSLIPYIREHKLQGGRMHDITRHILGLFHGVPGARTWRRILSEKGIKKEADEAVLLEALDSIRL